MYLLAAPLRLMSAVTALVWLLAGPAQASEGLSGFVGVKAMAERGLAGHEAARDFASTLAESGEFDADMTQWLRDNAAYNERQMALDQMLIEIANKELQSQDPKATEPSQALTQYLAERQGPKATEPSQALSQYLADQGARAQRDTAAAQRLAAQKADGRTVNAFNESRSRTSQAANINVQAVQKWTTIVIDSTGELILNDRDDVSEAKLEDLARQQAELDRQVRSILEHNVRELAPKDLGDRDSQIAAVIDELRPSDETPEQRVAALEAAHVDLSKCRENLEFALARLKQAQENLTGCQDTVLGCDFQQYNERLAAHNLAEAECYKPAMRIDRERAAAGLEITRAEMRRLGIGQPEPLEEVELVDITQDKEPESQKDLEPADDAQGKEAAPREEVELVDITKDGEAATKEAAPQEGASQEEVELIDITQGQGRRAVGERSPAV